MGIKQKIFGFFIVSVELLVLVCWPMDCLVLECKPNCPIGPVRHHRQSTLCILKAKLDFDVRSMQRIGFTHSSSVLVLRLPNEYCDELANCAIEFIVEYPCLDKDTDDGCCGAAAGFDWPDVDRLPAF